MDVPLRRRMRGDTELENPAPVVGQYQEHLQDLEVDRRDREEVDLQRGLDVVLDECPLRLRWRLAVARHVLADVGLADFDAEFE